MATTYKMSEVLSWHKEYLDMRNTSRAISKKYDIKHETMLNAFRAYSLWLRPPGFRPNNCKGQDGKDVLRLKYLWLYKFAYKRRAERKLLEFTLTEDRFVELVTSECAYCGKSYLEETRLVGKTRINMLTVDRFDSSKGYTDENCKPCCKVCNTIKMDIPFDQWIQHIKRIAARA
jgi:hypothetical protein